MALISTVFALLLAELLVGRFVVASHGFVDTRASQRWFARYWRPVNRHGYRDAEPDPALLVRTRRLVIVGDSVAAGHGIRDPADRFGDRLRTRLGDDWSVVLLAKPGWSPRDQIEALRSLPFNPQVVLLQHSPNDIGPAAEAHGLSLAPAVERFLRVQPAWLSPLVAHSDLANLVYWRARVTWSADELARAYARLLRSYEEERVWATHASELDALVAEARRGGARVVAVVVPDLTDLEGTRSASRRVAAHLRTRGVEIVELDADLAGVEARRRVVNPSDRHPSALVHEIVATRALEQITAAGEP